MKTQTLIITFLILTFCNTLFALTGREIIEKSDNLPEPKSAKSLVSMIIYKGSRTMKKEFKMLGKKIKGNDRMIISFLKPTRIKLLTHTHTGRDDDQWLRLSSGKIKRIAGGDKDKPFVNSHFCYEDMSSIDIDDYNYKSLDLS